MKIGIITIHNSPSYGGSLQSYALYKYLELQGFDVEIIDLHRPYQKDYKTSSIYKVYTERTKYRRFVDSIKKVVKNFINRKSKIESNYSQAAYEKFLSFNKMIKCSKPYLGCDTLYNNPPIYDAYVTGSDQVWNPYQPYCIEPYFLTFVPKGKKRISYAASIGLDKLPDIFEPKVAQWLKMYDNVSVREKKTADYLKSLTGLNISTVADPTFLLESAYWKKIAVYPQKKKYILMFTLSHMPEVLSYCQQLSKESGLELISLRMNQSEYSSKDNYTIVTDAGPAEFLGYMANAEIVITNSFHGTVFAFLMSAKNVFTYIPEGNKRGVRIVNLYNELGYSNHILRGNLTKSYSELQDISLNKELVQNNIEKMSTSSRNFLLNSLKNE